MITINFEDEKMQTDLEVLEQGDESVLSFANDKRWVIHYKTGRRIAHPRTDS